MWDGKLRYALLVPNVAQVRNCPAEAHGSLAR
jgi:hypothetical protein